MSSETDRTAAGDEGGGETDTYVHDPSAFDESGERRSPNHSSGRSPRESGERIDAESGSVDAPHPEDVDREFDWRGWTLVGVVFFSFVVAPLVVYLRPPQLGWRVTLIVFPLLPAMLLGAVAVWATTRP